MKRFRAGMKVGAPVVVVLAAVVNTAVAADQPLATTALARPDLNWAIQNASRDSVRNTRAYLAAKAAAAIHSLDQLSGAPALILASQDSHQQPRLEVSIASTRDHVRSTHQHSAP